MGDNSQNIPPGKFRKQLSEYQQEIDLLKAQNKRLKKKVDSLVVRQFSDELELLFNATGQGIIIRDANGKITFANPAASHILGVKNEALLNINSFEPSKKNRLLDGTIITADEHPAKIALTTAKEVHRSILGVFNPEKNTYIWISITATPMFEQQSDIVKSVYTVFEDISGKIEADNLLKENEAKAKALIKTIPDLIVRISRDGKIIDVNGRLNGLFNGIYPNINSDIRQLFEPELSLKFIDAMEEAFESRKVQIFDYRMNLQNKGICYFEFRINSVGEREVTTIIRDVTEQKRSQRKMVEATRRLTTLIGNLTGMVYRCLADEYWTMLFVSDGVKDLTGYTSEELNYNAALAYNDVIYSEDRDYVVKEVEDGGVRNKRFALEYRIITKSGQLKWVFEQGLTIKDKLGRPLFIEGYIVDITEKKIAEQNLVLSESKFRLLFNSLTEAIFVHPWSIEGFQSFVEVNDIAVERYAYTRKEFLKMSVVNLVPDDQLSENKLKKMRKTLSEKGCLFLEGVHRTKHGKEFPVELNANLIELNGKKYIQSVVRDISDRKRAEDELEHKSQVEESISKISADFVRASITEIDGAINKAIGKIGKLIHADRAYIFLLKDGGNSFERSYEWFLNDRVKEFPTTSFFRGEDIEYWLYELKKHGNFIVKNINDLPNDAFSNMNQDPRGFVKSLFTFPIFTQDKLLGFVGFDTIDREREWGDDSELLLRTFTDILAGVISRKRYEQELIFAKEKAEESDMLKSTFLASMSHELRTPLNAIIGFSTLVKSDSSPEKIVKWNDIIKSSGKHLLKIIESIFDVSLLQAKEAKVNYNRISLDDVFLTIQQYIKAELKKLDKTSLQVVFSKEGEDDIYLNTDRTKIIQMITNLLNNAIKYTDFGCIEYGYKVENDDLVFFVSDTGIGISKEHQEVIFDIFRQVDEPYFGLQSGVGLGLAICKEIAKLLDGELWLESEKGKGSCFFFKLNKAICKENCVENEFSNDISVPYLKGRTILVVEDIQFNYQLIEEMLLLTSAKVIWAQTGFVAVDKVRNNKEIDLILMDVKMPQMDGYRATIEILKMKPGIPIIAQTAYALPGDQKKAIDVGCRAYLTKPIDKSKLYVLLSEFIG